MNSLTCDICNEAKPENHVRDIRICKSCLDDAGRTSALRQAIREALQNLRFGEESVATNRLIEVLEKTK